jgi:MOSC domain-containing protein YiiM
LKIMSLNIGSIRTIEWRGRAVETAIYKEPVPGPLRAGRLGLAGDRQASPQYHGGPDKAVYSYAAEHYAWWTGELGRELPWGAFGENLTTEGLDEGAICVGDRVRAGGAVLEAVSPREPCSKLAARFQDAGMVRRFAKAGRFGIYWRVVEEGDIRSGDPLEAVFRAPERRVVASLARTGE